MENEMEQPEEPGLLPIGNHLPTAARSLLNSASIQMPSPQNSEISGLRNRDNEALKPIGKPLTGTAVAKRLTVSEAMRTLDPDNTDKALLASLPASVASLVREKIDYNYSSPYGFDPQCDGFTRLAGPAPANLPAIIAECERSMERCPREFAVKELARVRLMTKARAEDERDLSAIAAIFAEELRLYPMDVVSEACRRWTRCEKWWPSWAELKDKLDHLVRRRARLIVALKSRAA